MNIINWSIMPNHEYIHIWAHGSIDSQAIYIMCDDDIKSPKNSPTITVHVVNLLRVCQRKLP